MENQAAKSVIVTTAHTCVNVDGHALFSVKAGVPVALAFEAAGNMLDCIDRINLNRANLGANTTATCLQYLTDFTRSLVSAGLDGLNEYERSLV